MTNPVQVTQEAIDEVLEALTHAKNTFYRYAKLHRAKDTEDGDAKACDNAGMGEEMDGALDALTRLRVVTNDRIADLEAAVTRLTLALEMERGRGQPRGKVTQERECGVCKGSGEVDSSLQPDGKKTCPCCGGSGSRSEAAEHDRSFPDLGPSGEDEVERVARALHGIEESWHDYDWEHLPPEVQEDFKRQARAAIAAITPARTVGEDEVERQDVLREIVEIAALYYDAADTMLDGPDESDEDMARGCIREAHKRLLAIKPAMDAALAPTRTYEQSCTCHPDDRQYPCPKKYAASECAKASRAYEQGIEEALKELELAMVPSPVSRKHVLFAQSALIRSLGTKP